MDKNLRLAIIVTAVYAIFTLTGVINHEVWDIISKYSLVDKNILEYCEFLRENNKNADVYVMLPILTKTHNQDFYKKDFILVNSPEHTIKNGEDFNIWKYKY